jgi:hypothetical protein
MHKYILSKGTLTKTSLTYFFFCCSILLLLFSNNATFLLSQNNMFRNDKSNTLVLLYFNISLFSYLKQYGIPTLQTGMLRGASSFNQDVSLWDVSSGRYFVSGLRLFECFLSLEFEALVLALSFDGSCIVHHSLLCIRRPYIKQKQA